MGQPPLHAAGCVLQPVSDLAKVGQERRKHCGRRKHPDLVRVIGGNPLPLVRVSFGRLRRQRVIEATAQPLKLPRQRRGSHHTTKRPEQFTASHVVVLISGSGLMHRPPLRGSGQLTAGTEQLIQAARDPQRRPLLAAGEPGNVPRIARHLAGQRSPADFALIHQSSQRPREPHPHTPFALTPIDSRCPSPVTRTTVTIPTRKVAPHLVYERSSEGAPRWRTNCPSCGANTRCGEYGSATAATCTPPAAACSSRDRATRWTAQRDPGRRERRCAP